MNVTKVTIIIKQRFYTMRKLLIFFVTFLFYSQTFAQDWEVIGDMPIPVTGAKAIVQDTAIYIFGGYSDSLLGIKNIQVFYPKSRTWKILEDSLIVPRYGLSTESYADSVYIFGGATTANDSNYSVEQWGFNDNSIIRWYNPNFNRSFSTTAMINEYLFIFGGYPNFQLNDSLSYLVCYNMLNGDVTDTFSINNNYTPEDMPNHQMSAIINNKIYIFGGISGNILRDIGYFDLNTNIFTAFQEKLPAPRAAGVAIPSPEGDSIILIGGLDEESKALNNVDIYNVWQKTIENKSPLNIARSELTAVLYDDSIYVFGGKDATPPEGKVVSSVEKVTLPLGNITANLAAKDYYVNKDFELIGNYPNPFNPLTHIVLQVNKPQYIYINIFNIEGKLIKSLFNNFLPQGKHNISWNATDNMNKEVASGIYFYTISSGKLTTTNRMLLIK